MAYIYADMDFLSFFQQEIVNTLPELLTQIGCKDDLIENTRLELVSAVDRAEEALKVARLALEQAEKQLREAEQRTIEYNQHLAEGQDPISTSPYYYSTVEEREEEYSVAERVAINTKEIQSSFDVYARNYEVKQADGLNNIKRLMQKSGAFFEQYIALLVSAKKATAVNDSNYTSQKGVVGKSAESVNNPDSAESVIEYGQQWAQNLSSEQTAAIRDYTAAAYVNINSALRKMDLNSFDEGNKTKAQLMHQVLASSRIPVQCTVYRGASSEALGYLSNKSDDELLGAFFADRGFLSTSINKKDAFAGDIQLEIEVPAGAHGAYVGYISQYGHNESEVLFDIGQKFVISSVRRDSQGRRVISAKMLV